MKLVLEVIGAPVGKAHKIRHLGKFKSIGATPASEVAMVLVRRTFQDKYPEFVPIKGRVMLSFTAYMPIPKSWSKKQKAIANHESMYHIKKPDLKNIVALLEDALNCVACVDDSQIAIYNNCQKVYSDRPRLEIFIEEIGVSHETTT